MDAEYLKKVSNGILEDLFAGFTVPISNAIVQALIKGYEIGFEDCMKVFNFDKLNIGKMPKLSLEELITQNSDKNLEKLENIGTKNEKPKKQTTKNPRGKSKSNKVQS